MDDYYEIIKCGKVAVRLCIWETNKGPELGYVKWQISQNEEGYWVNRSSVVITTIDRALRDGRAMLHSTASHLTGLGL